MYIVRCDLTALSQLLPLCDGSHHVSWLIVPFWSLILGALTIVLAQIAVLYVTVLIPVIIYMNRLIRELGASDEFEEAGKLAATATTTKPALRNPENFIHFYCCLFLFSGLLNEVLFVIMPSCVSFIAMLIPILAFLLIRAQLSILFQAIFTFSLVCLSTNLIIILVTGAEMSTRLAELKEKRQKRCKYPTKYLLLRFRACTSIKLYMGNFTTINRFTPLVVFAELSSFS